MAFVDDTDIQTHLPADKLNLDNVPDDVEAVIVDVDRIIRGNLAGVFEPATIAAWVDPATTPGQVRAVGGRLGAALIYRVRFSEDDTSDPEFAQNLYNQAMDMLQKIMQGKIILDGVTDVGSQFDNTYFFPNSTADDPIFSMGDRY